jgi:hypothetical protein
VPETDIKKQEGQKKYKKWLHPQTIIQLLTLLAVVYYAYYAKKQWGTTTRQLEMADRPWLRDEVESASDLMFSNGTISWTVTIKVQNIGHSVATEVFPDVRLIAIQGADSIGAPRKKVTEICDSMPKRFDAVKGIHGLWNNSIFSEDSRDFGMSVILSSKDMDNALIDGGKALGQSVMPMLVGCIEYRYPTSERPHHTGFVYVLSHDGTTTDADPAQVFFSIGRNIPKTNVVLRRVGQVAD